MKYFFLLLFTAFSLSSYGENDDVIIPDSLSYYEEIIESPEFSFLFDMDEDFDVYIGKIKKQRETVDQLLNILFAEEDYLKRNSIEKEYAKLYYQICFRVLYLESILGNTKKNIEYAYKRCIIGKEINGESDIEYLCDLQELSDAYSKDGDYKKALLYGDSCYSLIPKLKDVYPIEYKCELLDSLSNYAYYISDFGKLLSYSKENRILKKTISQPIGICNYYVIVANYGLKNYNDVIVDFKENIKESDLESMCQTIDIHDILSVVGLSYMSLKQYDKSLDVFSLSKKNIEKLDSSYLTNEDYINISHYVLLCHLLIGDKEKLKEQEVALLTLLSENLGLLSEQYINTKEAIDLLESYQENLLSIKSVQELNNTETLQEEINKDGYEIKLRMLESSKDENKELLTVADSLYITGKDLYKNHNYDQAIKYFMDSDSLILIAKGKESKFYGYGKLWSSSCYHKLGQDSIANSLSRYYAQQPIDRLKITDANILFDKIHARKDSVSKIEIIDLYIKASEIEKKALGPKSYWYANSLMSISQYYLEIADYYNSEKYAKKALKIYKDALGNTHPDVLWPLNLLSKVAFNLKNDNSFLDYLLEIRNYYTQNHEKSHEYFVVSQSAASIQVTLGKYYDAKNTIMDLVTSPIDSIKTSDIEINGLFFTVYNYCILTQDFSLMQCVYDVFKDKMKSLTDETRCWTYIILGKYSHEKGDIAKTILYQKNALESKPTNFQKEMTLTNISYSYRDIGNIEKEYEYAKQAVDFSVFNNSEGQYYAKTALAAAYFQLGRKKEALRLTEECDSFYTKNDIISEVSLTNKANMAYYYSNLGNSKDALSIYLDIINECKKNDDFIAILSATLEKLSSFVDDDETRISLMEKSYDLIVRKYGELHFNSISSLFHLGQAYFMVGKFVDAHRCLTNARDLSRKQYGINNVLTLEIYETLAEINKINKEYNNAYDYFNQIIPGRATVNGSNSWKFVTSLMNYTKLCEESDNIDKIRIYKECLPLVLNGYKKLYNENLHTLTKAEKCNFLGETIDYIDNFVPQLLKYHNDSIQSIIYDMMLVRKSLLLHSETELKKTVLTSDDDTLRELYSNMNFQRNHNSETVHDSKKEFYKLEDTILKLTEHYYENANLNFVSWKDIQNKLKDNEVAIEFIIVPDSSDVSRNRYEALLISKKLKAPKYFSLCSEEELNNYVSDLNFDFIWKPFLEYLEGKNNVYIAPVGIINKIGIEYSLIDNSYYLNEKYNIFRVSSTKEILSDRKEQTVKNVLLYGGLDYNANIENNIDNSNFTYSPICRGSELEILRSGFDYLQNAKTEVDDISSCLDEYSIKYQLMTGELGTESHFKNIESPSPNIIHIATHGCYIPEGDNDNNMKHLQKIRLRSMSVSMDPIDLALRNSFLVMAGGNLLLKDLDAAIHHDDGLLTAYEISNLDLSNTDLVVLSACQTALGDISNEGVAGLQYGFWMAGVKSLLVSTNNIDDKATRLLMVEFYRQLLSGNTKFESLRNAQQYLRTVENGKYKDPHYWTSFILLNALE